MMRRDLKENEIQFQRYHRISKYIYNNYMNKISLQDIASHRIFKFLLFISSNKRYGWNKF